jgi:hypothetical protein
LHSSPLVDSVPDDTNPPERRATLTSYFWTRSREPVNAHTVAETAVA